jgi:predicted esterase
MGPETYNSALSSVQEIIATEGPFDACIGFSQGAVLLSTLIISHQREHPFEQDLFKMAVFFSGSSPFEVDDYGQWIPIDPATMKNGKIRIPTTHIYGIKDDIAKECSKLAGCCEPSVQAIFKHDLGHEIPRRPISVVEKMVKAVEKSVRNARFGM